MRAVFNVCRMAGLRGQAIADSCGGDRCMAAHHPRGSVRPLRRERFVCRGIVHVGDERLRRQNEKAHKSESGGQAPAGGVNEHRPKVYGSGSRADKFGPTVVLGLIMATNPLIRTARGSGASSPGSEIRCLHRAKDLVRPGCGEGNRGCGRSEPGHVANRHAERGRSRHRAGALGERLDDDVGCGEAPDGPEPYRHGRIDVGS